MRVLQHGHRIRVRNNSLAIWRRTWGKVGCGGGPAGARSAHLFSPKPHVLEEAQGDHGQNHVVAQGHPVATLQVIEAEFFLHLLVPLFADPPGLDIGGQNRQRRALGVR